MGRDEGLRGGIFSWEILGSGVSISTKFLVYEINKWFGNVPVVIGVLGTGAMKLFSIFWSGGVREVVPSWMGG